MDSVRLELSRLGRIILWMWAILLAQGCYPLPPLSSYAGPVTFSGPSEGNCSSTLKSCLGFHPNPYRVEYEAALRELGRVAKDAHEAQQTTKTSLAQITASLDGLRRSLRKPAGCDDTVKCPEVGKNGLSGDVRVIGLEDQAGRLIEAIHSLRENKREGSVSELGTIGEALRKLTEGNQDLIQRVDTLEKNAHKNESEKNSVKRWMTLLGFAGVGILLGWLVNRKMGKDFTPNPYLADEADLANCGVEITDGYKHYSTLRFAVFTLFVAMSGALGTLHFGKDYQYLTKELHPLIPALGIFLSMGFALMEFVVDLNQTEYFYMARAAWMHNKRIALGRRERKVSDWNQIVRYPIWTIFGIVAGVWVIIWNL